GGIEASLGDSRRLLREYRGKAAARSRTQSVLVVREDLQDLQILEELERLPRCFVDLRDAGHVAGVVERDLLRERLREGNPFFAEPRIRYGTFAAFRILTIARAICCFL